MVHEIFLPYAFFLVSLVSWDSATHIGPISIKSDLMSGRARPRAKSGRKFVNGQVFLVFILAPTGNGLSFFRTATRSGFERCNKNSNPIINPIFTRFLPDILPDCYSSSTHIYFFQLIFHIPAHLQLTLALDHQTCSFLQKP